MERATRPRQARARLRRRQIIEAALACFSEAGMEATTMEQIRRRSGASTGSIYHLFGSKEELAAAVYLEGLERYQDGFMTELERHTAARAGVLAVVAYHLAWIEEHPTWARFLLHMRHLNFLAASETAIAELNANFTTRVGRWFRGQVDGGRIRKIPRSLFGSILLGASQDFAGQWLAGRVDTTPAAAALPLGQAAWRALKA